MNIIKQWPVFFLLLAFAISPLFMGEENDVIACIHILVLAVFLKEFLSSYKEFRIPYNSLALSICLFYIWIGLSISWSPSPVISLHTFVWLSIFPLCFFTYSIKQSFVWSTLAKGAVILTLFIAFIGIIQRLFSVPPPSSFFQERNTFAALMNLFALPVTAYFITPRETNNRLSMLLGAALFVLFFAVFQSGSRGAMISLLFGLFFIAVTSWQHMDKSFFKKVFIILTAAFITANFQMGGYVLDRVGELSSVPDSGIIRWILWQSVWRMIMTAPIVGHGIGTFYIFAPSIQQLDNTGLATVVHNDYLQFWLETGFIGLSLMLLIMVAIVRLYRKVLNNKKLNIKDRLENTGLMAGLFSAAVHSFVDFPFYIVSILVSMGFMCARIQEIFGIYFPELFHLSIPANKLSMNKFLFAAIIIPVLLLSYSLPLAVADFYWNEGRIQQIQGNYKNANKTLDLAAAWNPVSIGVNFQQFMLYRDMLNKNDTLSIKRRDLLSKAISALNKIESVNPFNGVAAEHRGHLLLKYKDVLENDWQKKALNEYKKALQFRPRLFKARMALARILERQGKLNEAVVLMNDGMRYDYNNSPWSREFYRHVIELNLMNGDTIKAREIQIQKDLLPGK